MADKSGILYIAGPQRGVEQIASMFHCAGVHTRNMTRLAQTGRRYRTNWLRNLPAGTVVQWADPANCKANWAAGSTILVDGSDIDLKLTPPAHLHICLSDIVARPHEAATRIASFAEPITGPLDAIAMTAAVPL